MSIAERISLGEPHSFRGKWWPLSDPADRRLGEFEFVPEGPSKLELHEPFESLQDEHGMVAIHGQSDGGQRLSLLSCFRSFRGGTLGGTGFKATNESYTVNRALVGGVDEDHADDALYHSLEMRVDHLEEWTGIRPFEAEQDKDQPHAITAVRLRDIPPFTCDVESIGAELGIDSTYSIEFGSFRQLCWQRRALVTLTPTEPHALDWFIHQAALIQSFFSLLIGHLVHTSHLSLRGAEREILPGVRDRWTIDVLYHRKGKPVSRPASHPAIMLLRFDDVVEKFPALLDAWCRNQDRLGLPMQILWSVQGGGFAYHESELIALTQSIEAFSRARSDGLYLSDEEWEPLYERMRAAIPPELSDDHRRSLDKRLFHGNEFSLRKRLTELLRGLPSDVQHLVAPDGVTKFVGTVVDTRNQLTHREHGQDYVLTGMELVRASLRLQLLLMLLGLQEIGVADEQLSPAARRCDYFRMIVPRK